MGARLNELLDMCQEHGETMLGKGAGTTRSVKPPPLLLDDFLCFNLKPDLATCDAIEDHLVSLECNLRALRKEMSEMSDAFKEVVEERNVLRL